MDAPLPATGVSSKYDRQLRMWGAHGQKLLAESRVCLLNASATGTEILKSLVLPGVGHITVVDGAMVTREDVGNNFFVAPACVGQPRAKVRAPPAARPPAARPPAPPPARRLSFARALFFFILPTPPSSPPSTGHP